MFKAVCPHCLAEYSLNDSLLGKTAHCKKCRRIFTLTADNSVIRIPKQTEEAQRDSGFDIKISPNFNSLKSEKSSKAPAAPKISKQTVSESGVWNIGDIILGVYEVKELAPGIPFAEGGVGVVHRVHHREWDRDLAVKSPKPQVFQTENGKQSYEKEAQTWIELGLHPNIVTCYLVRRIGNIPRLFAEFVGDGSLRDWIKDGRLYEGGTEAALLRILNIAVQFAWGLEHAHLQKLLHLDVKPANVMMAGQTAKVTDFGLAQGLTDNQSGGDAAVQFDAASSGGMTPGYCSPEQYIAFMYAQRKEYNKVPVITLQSDIWSWAVSVLAMFYGRPPCKKGGQTARNVFEQYLKLTPDNRRPKMPEALVEVMRHCFEEKPENRPASITEVADKFVKIYEDISGVPFPRKHPAITAWTPESINNRAASMLDLGKPDEARKLLDEAAQLFPWHPEVTYNQTLLAWRSGHLTDLEAVERLETLVKTRPQSAEALYALGLVQRERGNLQNALDAFESAAALEPREEFRRSISAASKLAGKSSRCVEKIHLAAGLEDKILLDNKGEFIFLPAKDETFVQRETLTGKIVNIFALPKPEQLQQNPLRIAVSVDLLWELLRSNQNNKQPEQFILKQTASTSVQYLCRLINWKHYFSGTGTDTNMSVKKDVIVPDSCVPYISSFENNYVIISDKKTKEKITLLFGHEDAVSAMVFSEDGHFVLTGSIDKTLRLWELPSGRCLRTFTSLGGGVDAVQFGNGSCFALSLIAGGSLRLWDISVLCGETPFRAPLLLSNIASAEEVSQQQSEMNQHSNKIREAVKESNFADAAALYKKLSEMSGWETARNQLESEGILDALFRKTVRESLADVLCTQSFTGHQDVVTTAVLSVDGNLAATSGRDNTIRIWNIAEKKCTAVLNGHNDWVRSIALTMDSKFIVSGSWDMSVRIWNIRSGKEVKRFDEKIKSLTKIALNPQGRIVASANGQGAVILWDVLNENIAGRFLAHNGSVNSLRFSRNGHYLITGGDDNKVCVWNLGIKSDEPVRTITAHNAPVTEAVLSTDLNTLISADREGRIIVWNLADNKLKFDLQGHFGSITGLELLADDRFFLSAAKDKKIRFEGIADRSVQRIIEGHPAQVLCLAADIAGKRCITGCEDAVVRIWDLYWNYGYCGQTSITPQAEKVLRTLLSLYSPDISAKNKPKIDEIALKRIFLEMEYRGFGTIPQEQLHAAVQEILEHWNGTETLCTI